METQRTFGCRDSIRAFNEHVLMNRSSLGHGHSHGINTFERELYGTQGYLLLTRNVIRHEPQLP